MRKKLYRIVSIVALVAALTVTFNVTANNQVAEAGLSESAPTLTVDMKLCGNCWS